MVGGKGAEAQKYMNELINEKKELLNLLRHLPNNPEECFTIIKRATELAKKTKDPNFTKSVEASLCAIILKGGVLPAYPLSVRKMALEAIFSLNPPKAITDVYPFLGKTNPDDVELRNTIERFARNKEKVIKM